jgi:hypothetical protein
MFLNFSISSFNFRAAASSFLIISRFAYPSKSIVLPLLFCFVLVYSRLIFSVVFLFFVFVLFFFYVLPKIKSIFIYSKSFFTYKIFNFQFDFISLVLYFVISNYFYYAESISFFSSTGLYT